MKTKTLLSVLFVLLMAFPSFAQRKNLYFYYVAHDYTTPVDVICERLEEEYNHALGYDDYALVFYLPNGDHPFVVKVNLKGDNRDDFNTFISELRTRYTHETYPYIDAPKIIDIFNQHDFTSEDGSHEIDNVLMTWYVNPTFWTMNYNESLIAAVYFALELDKYKDKVNLEFWHAEGDGLAIDQNHPFGTKNLLGDHQFFLLSM